MHKQMILVTCGIDRKSAAARFLVLRVLISLKPWTFVCL